MLRTEQGWAFCLLNVIQANQWFPVQIIVCEMRRFLLLLSLQAPTLTMEGGRVKRSLQLVPGRDFEIVPEPVWRALYHWYGANLSLPRPVSEGTSIISAAQDSDTKLDTYYNNIICIFQTVISFFCLKFSNYIMVKYPL